MISYFSFPIIVMQADCIFLDMHPPLNHLIKYFSICCRLFQVRGKLYELLVNCIPPEIILKVKTTFFHVVIVNFFFFFFHFEMRTFGGKFLQHTTWRFIKPSICTFSHIICLMSHVTCLNTLISHVI